MGLVLSHFAGVQVSPLKRQDDNMAAREGCPILCDLAHTLQLQTSQGQDLALGSSPNISRATSLVEVTPKRKFCEDEDSALGPPLKISRGTSLTIQTSAVNIRPILSAPLVIPSRKRRASEDQDLALGRPAKIPRIPSLVDPANLAPRGNSCFVWRLPNELLRHIATLLPRSSLLALTQMCQLLREIAAPHYFALLGFDTTQSNYLSLDDDGCEGLLVWRRTEAFVAPNSLCFSISQMTTDSHLCAVRTFFESLTGSRVIPRVHLLLYSGPDELSHSFLRLLECIRGSGCKELTCHGLAWGERPRICHSEVTSVCNTEIKSLELSSSLFFTSMSIAFTLCTLRSAPLVSLRLTNTALTAVQWTKFLGDLQLSSLRSLEVEATCPPRSLVEFLSRHRVKTLAIISSTLEYLGLRLGASSFTDCFLSDVLLCTEHLPGINELSVRIPAEADPHALALPQNSSRICLAKVKDLTLRILNSESDDNTILHCARWLPTFPEIEDLYLLIVVDDLFWSRGGLRTAGMTMLGVAGHHTAVSHEIVPKWCGIMIKLPACVPRRHAQVSNLLIPQFFSTPTKIFPHFFSDSSNMDGGKLPSYKVLYHFAFHPYARIKPSAREIVMAALYDDTYNERFIPSSFAIPSSSFAISPLSFVISGSGTASDGGRLPSCRLSHQYRFHPYVRVKPSAREVVMSDDSSSSYLISQEAGLCDNMYDTELVLPRPGSARKPRLVPSF
ncbi:hypothetical protein EDD15DRAFT_2193678 [Pisolithus albus]|nr:hypothetical protein EDD15DRAFT_2193678 [Pisolithus albus]